jgi:hypothetical protein
MGAIYMLEYQRRSNKTIKQLNEWLPINNNFIIINIWFTNLQINFSNIIIF